jgi:anaerobic ribonucleoside-triphosphate reductase
LPYLALESKTIEEFYSKLEDMIDYVSKTQKSIYDVIVDSPVDVAPILYMYGVLDRAQSGTKIKDVIGNRKCSVSIGYMGIAECVERFGIHYNTKEGHDLGISIIKHMFDRANYNKEKYDIALSLYGTPAESLTTKFAKALKVFPIISHINDRTYITNSYHIPVETEIDAFSKMDFESEFQKYSTGGCISYVEVPDVRNNPEAIFELMKHIYDVMVYCEINTTSCSICYNCGFEGEIELSEDGTHCTCPNCGCTDPSKLHVVLRSCGYLGEYSLGTSIGRAGDIVHRVKHL